MNPAEYTDAGEVRTLENTKFIITSTCKINVGSVVRCLGCIK